MWFIRVLTNLAINAKYFENSSANEKLNQLKGIDLRRMCIIGWLEIGTGVSIVCSTVCSDADRRKHLNAASLAFVRGIHRWPVDSPHKGPVTQFPFDDVIMFATWDNDQILFFLPIL